MGYISPIIFPGSNKKHLIAGYCCNGAGKPTPGNVRFVRWP